jgi:hypothetical protein
MKNISAFVKMPTADCQLPTANWVIRRPIFFFVSRSKVRTHGKNGRTHGSSPTVTRLLSQFLILLLLASCDIIEAPFMETSKGDTTAIANPQKVLLFDFTGHTCKSCPKAHKSIEQLIGLYGDRLVPVAFHLGYFAKPLTSGKFSTDFRTSEGTLLEKHFEFTSFPIGSVQTLNSQQLQPYASWPAAVAANITGNAPVRIGIAVNYLSGLNAVTAKISLTAMESVTGQLNLAVYLVEDSIIDWQKDEDFDPMDIPDYVHNHVFRTSLNGLWGQTVGNADGIAKDYIFETEFSKILNTGWKVENCVLIAFVYRQDTREVLQVETKKF